MKYFKNKTVLITGAGGALGSIMTDRMLDFGATVLAVDIAEGALAGRKQKGLYFFKCDLSQAAQIAALVQTLRKGRFSVDILVNNAGIVNGSFLHETEAANIQKALAINLVAPILLVRYLASDLAKNKGHLVDISSAAGIVGVSRLSDYSAAKFGLFGFNEAMRCEWKKLKKKISTTVICPFYLQTDMFKGVQTRFPLLLPILPPEKAVNRMLRSIASKKKRETFLFMVWSVWLLRLFPVAFFDTVSSFFGINKSMDEFVGKSGKAKIASVSGKASSDKKNPSKAPANKVKAAVKKSAKSASKKTVKASAKGGK